MLLNKNNRPANSKWSLADVDYDVLTVIAKNLHAYKKLTNKEIESHIKSAIISNQKSRSSSSRRSPMSPRSPRAATTRKRSTSPSLRAATTRK
jgi:hypothetical protein